MKTNGIDRNGINLSTMPTKTPITQSATKKRNSPPDSFLSSATRPKKSIGANLVPASISVKQATTNLTKKLGFALNQQTGDLRTSLVNNSREHFKSQVPYVIGVDASSGEKIHFDLDRQLEHRCASLNTQEDIEKAIKLWMKHLSPMRFYAFLNANTKPIDLGSMGSLEKKGLSSIPIILSLLTPLEEPEKANVLYLLLAETNYITPEAKNHLLKSLIESDPSEIDCIKESILVAAAESEAPAFLLSLLKANVSPNSLDMNTGFYAVNAAQQAHRYENVKILIAHGANPDVKIIQNPY